MNTKRLFISVVCCCLSLLYFVSITMAQAPPNFLLAPNTESSSSEQSYFVYEAQVGTIITDSVVLSNKGTDPIRLQLFAADAMTASSGSVTAKTEWGDTPQAGGTWLDLTTQEIELAAGEAQAIPFTLSVPDNISAGEYAASIVAQLADESDEAAGLRFIPRFAVTVMTTVTGTEPLASNLEVVGVSAETGRTGHTLITQLHNSGNDGIHRITGELTISDANQQPVAMLPIQLGYFLAGDSLNYRLDLGMLPAGPYEAAITTQYDDKALEHIAPFTLASLEQPKILLPETEGTALSVTLTLTVAPTLTAMPTSTPTLVSPTLTPEPQITSTASSIIAIGDTSNNETEVTQPIDAVTTQGFDWPVIGLILSVILLITTMIVVLCINSKQL